MKLILLSIIPIVTALACSPLEPSGGLGNSSDAIGGGGAGGSEELTIDDVDFDLADPTFAEVGAVLKAGCLGSDCHSGAEAESDRQYRLDTLEGARTAFDVMKVVIEEEEMPPANEEYESEEVEELRLKFLDVPINTVTAFLDAWKANDYADDPNGSDEPAESDFSITDFDFAAEEPNSDAVLGTFIEGCAGDCHGGNIPPQLDSVELITENFVASMERIKVERLTIMPPDGSGRDSFEEKANEIISFLESWEAADFPD